MSQNDSDLIQMRIRQIDRFKAYKRLIGETYNLLEVDLLKNEGLMIKLKKNVKEVIQSMLKYYKQNGLAFIFVLFTDDNSKYREITKPKSYFHQLIKTVTNMIKDEKVIEPFKKQLLSFSSSVIIMIESTKMFLQSLPQGHEIKLILQDLKIFTIFLQDKQRQNAVGKVSERSLKFMKLMDKIYAAKIKIQQQGSQSTKKEIYLQAGYEILKMHSQSIFQEVTINRLKKMTQNFLLSHQSQASLPYCCTLSFRKQSYFIKMQSYNQEHKDYHWPITLEKILKHVRKTIVGFLNLEGGIIYIGMKEKPQCVEAKGIYLSQNEIIDFFKWLYIQCQYIYPKFSAQIEKEMQQMYQQNLENLKERINEKSYHYHVNNHVSVEFLTMVDNENDMDIIEENSIIFRKSYMLKIKIKPGTKAETFHLLKEGKDGEIQCYKRNDASVNKLSLIEFINFYNERIEAFMEETAQQPEALWNQCPYRHFKQFCKKSLV